MKLHSILKISAFGFLSALLFASCEDILVTGSTAKLEGQWRCVEQHEADGYSNYDIEIDIESSDSTVLYIYNFLNLQSNPSIPVYARVRVQGNSINIPRQTVAGHTVEGSGTISADYKKITLTYTDDLYGDMPWSVSSTYTKY